MLIKSVLTSLPMYYMGLFKIPKKVVKKLISLQRDFFWSGKEHKKGMPLIKWETIQKSKHLGGLGVGDLQIKNVGLLFKWWWRFSSEGNTLWKRVICSIHNLDSEIPMLNIQNRRGNSEIWSSIITVNKWGG